MIKPRGEFETYNSHLVMTVNVNENIFFQTLSRAALAINETWAAVNSTQCLDIR